MSPNTYAKPRLFISRCIEFASCRWDGEIINNEVVRALKDYVDFLPTCPEMEIGLSIPRDPLQVIVSRKKKSLVQIKDKRDFTSLIKVFAAKFLETQRDLDGFILKSKSPSCGAYSTKFFKSADSTEPIAMGSGVFAEIVQKFFPLLPIIEESDLSNGDLLDYFLTRVYTLAAFRMVVKEKSLESLRQFQEKNEILFKWFNPALLASMETLLKKDSTSERTLLFSNYHTFLLLLLHQRPPFEDSVKNLLGVISEFIESNPNLPWREMQEIIEKYQAGSISLFTTRLNLKSWAVRNHCEEILKQTFCEPYPSIFSNPRSVAAPSSSTSP